MIYLIGGPAKVGKSKLAERLLQEQKIPYLPTDVFIEALKENKHSEFKAEERAAKFFPYFSALVKVLPGYRDDFCVEGNGFMPEHVKALENKVDSEFRVLFVGMSEANLDQILKYSGPQTWLMTDLTEKQREDYPKWLVKNSQEVERQCKKYGYQYFDLAGDYEAKFEQAYNFLGKVG